VREADVIYTDTWVSMGQEAEKSQRLKDFHGYEVNQELLAEAPKNAVVLHCLPAYRGLEISDEVIEGKQSLVFPQAENRLHFQKGLLAVLMGRRSEAGLNTKTQGTKANSSQRATRLGRLFLL